jgi:5-formyltetrahydrofolate cyclo-ligase
VQAAGAAVRAQLEHFHLYRVATAVVAYVAAENEIPTAQLVEEAFQAHRDVYLPAERGEVALVHWHCGEPLVAGRSGISEPATGLPAVPGDTAVALIPLVAWDVKGTRVGRGGGFYDRLFVVVSPRIPRIGLAYEFQEVQDLPRDPWDLPLDYVITERRIVDCGYHERTARDTLQKGGLEP